MLELVTMNEGGGNGPGGSDGSPTPFGDCIQTLFHACARNHIFMVFPRLVLIVDLEIHQPVGVIHVEKSSANIIQGEKYIRATVCAVSITFGIEIYILSTAECSNQAERTTHLYHWLKY